MILLFEPKTWLKLRYFVEQCETEISGLGKIEYDGINFVVTDVVILDQIASDAHCEMTEKALDKFVFEQTKKKTVGCWRLWWHSHATMGTFFSQTDKDTISTSTEFDWFVSLVVNHKMETKARIDQHKPFRATEDNIDVRLLEEEDVKLKEVCLKEIEKKVKPEVEEVVVEEDWEKDLYNPPWMKQDKKKQQKQLQKPLDQEELAQQELTGVVSSIRVKRNWANKKIQSVFIKKFTEDVGEWVHVLYKGGKGQWSAYEGEESLPMFTKKK